MRAAAGREVLTSCGDQAGQGPGEPSREREKMGRARPCELEGRAVGRAGPWEGPGRGKGRAVGRAGPWEGRAGPCGPSGERERGRAEPVHTNSIPLWPVSGRTQRREQSMRPTRVTEARHHGLPGGPRSPRGLPPGREASRPWANCSAAVEGVRVGRTDLRQEE